MRWLPVAFTLSIVLSGCSDSGEIVVLRKVVSSQSNTRAFPETPADCQFPTAEPEKIIVMATPATNADTVRASFEPIFARLASTTGRNIEFIVPATYADLETAIGDGTTHLALISPLNYIRAKNKNKCVQLLLTSVSGGFHHYSSYLMVRADSGLTSLEDLAGKRMALLTESSASGYLYPKKYFKDKGIDIRDYFDVIEFNNHLEALKALSDTNRDPGGRSKSSDKREKFVDIVPTYAGAFPYARREGVNVGEFRVFDVMDRIPNDALVASAAINPILAQRLALALYELNAEFSSLALSPETSSEFNGWIFTSHDIYAPLAGALAEESK
jgi:phosphate/phosphite/phosphonate ABC transporter binding protein